jgi:hypothetical protein
MASEGVWLLGLFFVPGLLALMLLMQWLEQRLTRNMVVDEILLALTDSYPPDELETTAARRLAKVLGDLS